MLRKLLDVLGRIASLLISLIITAGLAAFVWWLWAGYEDARLERRFAEEGQSVVVTVTDADRERRSWRDAFGGVAYVSFSHRAKTYAIRFRSDTLWVSAGDRVRLLYHPQLDAFRQPTAVPRRPNSVTSRLIDWSSTKGFSKENQLLGAFALMAALLVFFGGGVVVSLTGWTFLQRLTRLLLVMVLGGLAVFFTYDTLEYVRYYQRLRTHGQLLQLAVLHTDRTAHGRYTTSRYFTYEATVNLGDQELLIPMEEAEYETLHPPTDRLTVIYDRDLDDAMSATYTMAVSPFFTPVFLWVMFGWACWPYFLKKR